MADRAARPAATRSFGFVTGAQMANFTALAAARHHVLAQAGWDVERDGLQGAPKIRVVVGAKRHGTIDRALRMLGLGAPTDIVPADTEGRMLAGELRIGDEPTIVCAQAGEVEHRCKRSVPRDRRRARRRRECVGARRRCLRALGGGNRVACDTSSTASSAPTPGRRTRTNG